MCAAAIGCEKAPQRRQRRPRYRRLRAAAAAPEAPRARAALTGEVSDYHGRPLSGVQVTARDDARAWNVSVFTDGNGHYAFPPLETGAYRLWVRLIGFERRERAIELPPEGLDVDFGSLRTADDPYAQLPATYYFSLMDWPSARRARELRAGLCELPPDRRSALAQAAHARPNGTPWWRA